jgi:hypothetical protein
VKRLLNNSFSFKDRPNWADYSDTEKKPALGRLFLLARSTAVGLSILDNFIELTLQDRLALEIAIVLNEFEKL